MQSLYKTRSEKKIENECVPYREFALGSLVRYGNQINLLRYKLENNKEAPGKGKVVQSLKTNPPVEAKNHS